MFLQFRMTGKNFPAQVSSDLDLLLDFSFDLEDFFAESVTGFTNSISERKSIGRSSDSEKEKLINVTFYLQSTLENQKKQSITLKNNLTLKVLLPKITLKFLGKKKRT